MKFGKLIGAIDEGTSSARFMIFKAGTDEIVCYHQMNVPQIYPQEGWVEQDPMLILTVVSTCIDEALKKLIELGGQVQDIVAVGVTNQRESTLVWDKNTGKPLHNAIIWLDMRTSSTVDHLMESIPNKSYNKNYLKPLCGLPMSPYFSGLKLRWLKDNVPHVTKAMKDGTCLFGNVDAWLIWNLTGGLHMTDVTNASRTMLMNIETLQWDSHLLKFFDLPRSILPEIHSSAEVYGNIAWPALKGIPIAACMGDQQAALVGQQCLQRGQAKATFGTGCFLLYNTGNSIVSSAHGLLTTVGYQLGKNANPFYALEGSVAIAGAALNWLKDNLGIVDEFSAVEKIANKVDDCGDVYFVPAFSGLYAPYWNQEARGVICGISDQTTSEHIVRATLEAVCFQVRDILDAMNKDCGIPLTKLKVDGGMTANSLLLQTQADLVGINVIRPKIAETTSLGIALAAYKAISDADIDVPVSNTDANRTFKPLINENERDMRYSKWKMAVDRSFGWDSSHSDVRNLSSSF
ncbi:glycerol kinase [Episyrphus balteatus]|uniref:glycerol kinase n=1 Tax=Episyrphus balteatus TaxID=286459 RepID=UPI002485B07C|nr:glycerol kinase [Episyrphus balteatus]